MARQYGQIKVGMAYPGNTSCSEGSRWRQDRLTPAARDLVADMANAPGGCLRTAYGSSGESLICRTSTPNPWTVWCAP